MRCYGDKPAAFLQRARGPPCGACAERTAARTAAGGGLRTDCGLTSGTQVPSGLLPAMELDGKLYTESATIAQAWSHLIGPT